MTTTTELGDGNLADSHSKSSPKEKHIYRKVHEVKLPNFDAPSTYIRPHSSHETPSRKLLGSLSRPQTVIHLHKGGNLESINSKPAPNEYNILANRCQTKSSWTKSKIAVPSKKNRETSTQLCFI